MKLSLTACAEALAHAALNRKAALQVELAVGLAVFAMHGDTSKEARAMLNDAYAAAGYFCRHINEPDYKTINRRINATASLYEKLPISKWIGRLADYDAIKAVCEGLEPYELFTVQDVLRYAAPAKVPPCVAVRPAGGLLAGPDQPAHTGQNGVMDQFRRATDNALRHLHTEHMQLSIPEGVPRAELIEMAMQLMTLAKESEKQLLTA